MTAQLPESSDVTALASRTLSFLRSLADPCVSRFLAEWPAFAEPSRESTATTLPVLQWLPRPAPEQPSPAREIVDHLHCIHHTLRWQQTYRVEDFGAAFLERYGWTELIGARGPIASDAIACGFLLLGPETDYPAHHHTAEEIYVVLSGTASWRRGNEDWVQRLPGTLIHHPSNVPHAMRTGQDPLLALYVWRAGDLAQKSVIG